jgi:hypothetical protein
MDPPRTLNSRRRAGRRIRLPERRGDQGTGPRVPGYPVLPLAPFLKKRLLATGAVPAK